MGNLLRERRTARGWSLHDLAGLTGVSVSYLSLVERGLRQPAPDVKVQIARALGRKVGELFPLRREDART